MARNRKHQTVAIRFAPALRAFLLCVLIGGSGIGYVWQKNQIAELSKQKKQRELRFEELKDTNDKLSRQLAVLQSVPQLERRVLELNLGLGPASPRQKLRLWEPVLDDRAAAKLMNPSQYASRPNSSSPMP
jgi:cell division protein FtsB